MCECFRVEIYVYMLRAFRLQVHFDTKQYTQYIFQIQFIMLVYVYLTNSLLLCGDAFWAPSYMFMYIFILKHTIIIVHYKRIIYDLGLRVSDKSSLLCGDEFWAPSTYMFTFIYIKVHNVSCALERINYDIGLCGSDKFVLLCGDAIGAPSSYIFM